MDDLTKLSKKELIEKLRHQETQGVLSGGVRFDESENEMNKLDKIAINSDPFGIPFKEISDHKNIMLYTALNKRVGPLHPDNARRTMVRWKQAGVQLYTRMRTDAEVEAFMQTDEYKRYKIKHDATRKQRHAQSSKGKTEQMMAEIAKVTAEAVAGVKK
jgi:hypothetical protein